MAKGRFADIIALGPERVKQIDEMMAAGAGAKRMRSVIKIDWKLWAEKSDGACEKLLTRYKREVVEANLMRELDKAGLADVRRMASAYNPLNVAHEMAMSLAEVGYHGKKKIDELMEQGTPVIPKQFTDGVAAAFKANSEYSLLLDKLGLRPKMKMTYREAVAPSSDPRVARIEITPAVARAAKRIHEALGDADDGDYEEEVTQTHVA